MATAAPTMFVSSKDAYHGPEAAKVADQLLALKNQHDSMGPADFAENNFWILRKNREKGTLVTPATGNWNRRLVQFRLNKIQLDLLHNLGRRNICLKPRQGGYTTFFLIMRMLLPCILSPGSNAILISQTHTDASLHFEMLKRAFRYFAMVDPANADDPGNNLSYELKKHLLHVKLNNKKELLFDQLESRIVITSAEIPEAGQGLTLNHAVCTEVARWPGNPEETLANMKEAIPDNGTLDMESTANGMGGYFFEECTRAAAAQRDNKPTEFRYFFHQWWWHDEYRLKKPVSEVTLNDEEKSLVKAFNLDMRQIAWRRKKIIQLRHNFAEKYPEDERTCFLSSGILYFDKEILRLRWLELSSYTPLQSFKKLKIYRRRIKGQRYVIAADVATGRDVRFIEGQTVKVTAGEDSKLDWSAAVVLDLETGEEMASYCAQLSEESYAQDLADLGRLYNNAIIAVERGGYGGTTIVCLETMCQYMHLYKHRDWTRKDKKLPKTGATGGIIEMLGFPTTPKTRPIALNRLKYFVQESPELVHDIRAVEEMLTFVINPKGKPEHSAGNHDDRVLCRAIGHYVRHVLLGYLDPLAIRPREQYGEDPSEFEEDIEAQREQEFLDSES